MPLTPPVPTIGPVAVMKIGTTVLPAQDWKFTYDGKLKDISNFAGGRQYTFTLPDGDMTFKVIYDQSNAPYDAAGLNLNVGANVTVQCFVDAAKFITVPLVIAKVTPGVAGMEDVLMWEVEAKLSGAITWPA